MIDNTKSLRKFLIYFVTITFIIEILVTVPQFKDFSTLKTYEPDGYGLIFPMIAFLYITIPALCIYLILWANNKINQKYTNKK